jgi:hypothetical protein
MTGVQPASMESRGIVRDPCPECGAAMVLARIETDQPGHDRADIRVPAMRALGT